MAAAQGQEARRKGQVRHEHRGLSGARHTKPGGWAACQPLGRCLLLTMQRPPVAAAYAPRRCRMILLAWAGSSSNVFATWQVKDAELIAVELPARNGYVPRSRLPSPQTQPTYLPLPLLFTLA